MRRSAENMGAHVMRGFLLAGLAACAIAAPASAQEVRYRLELPAQRLDRSLFSVAQQTGVQLVFTDPAIAKLKAPAISGNLTVNETLSTLLKNTRYTYRFASTNVVRIVGKDQPRGAAERVSYVQSPQPNSTFEPAAQSSAPTEATAPPEDEIVVVGSQIKGSSITSALPVTVVDAQAIAATGAVSGDELFRSIPQMGDVSFNSAYLPNSSNSARGDIGSVNLRGLGVGNTLVLINGRRVVAHPTSRADDNLVPVLTYNTNAIPVFGLERLEVLRDGAAAIYGSDAVAGVVNTVLRKDYQGITGEAQVGWAENTSLQEVNLNLLAGTRLGNRGSITLFVSHDRRSALEAKDQDYTASADLRPLFADTAYADNTSVDGRTTISPWGSFQTVGNFVVRQGATALTNASGQFHIQPATNAGCQTSLGNGICIDDGTNAAAGDRNLRFDAPAAFNTSVMPKITRTNIFLNGRYELTEGLEFFGEAGYYSANSRSVQSSTGTLAAGPVVIPASNYYNPFGAVTLPNGQPNPNRLSGINAPAQGVPVTLSTYGFADVGPNIVRVKNEQFRLLGGLRFEVLGFDVETAALYSEATVRDRSDGISQTLLQRQLALSTPDAYNPFNGSNLANPASFDTTLSNAAALNAISITTERFSKSSLALADIKASKRDLFALPAGDVGIAFGAEARRETQFDDRDPHVDGTITFRDTVTGFVNPSDLVGSSASPDTRGKRTVFAAYGELAIPLVSPEMNIPLVHRLDVQIAGRFEHYDDVGSVAKPKIAAAWDIVDGLRLRGSYAQGFKAPNLEQVNATVVTRSNTRTDYVRCEARLRKGEIANFTQCTDSFSTSAQRSGNPNLKPEESRAWSAGIVVEPRFLESALGRIILTADYWNIRQTGVVGLFGEGNALINDYLQRVGGGTDPNVVRSAPTADDTTLFAGTGLTPAGRVLFVQDQYRNLLPQEVAGIDLGLSWRLPPTSIGNFTLNLNAAYLDKFFLQPSPEVQALLDARAAGTINAGTIIAEQGNLIRRNGKPKWKASGSLVWNYDKFQIGAYTQYTGDVEDTGLVNATGTRWVIDDQLTFNLYGQVEVGDEASGRYRVRIGVRNLTDKKPPLSSSGYLASLYNPYARYWYANVKVSF